MSRMTRKQFEAEMDKLEIEVDVSGRHVQLYAPDGYCFTQSSTTTLSVWDEGTPNWPAIARDVMSITPVLEPA